MRIFFTIPGPPKGKARPRFNRNSGIAYTPKDTILYENLVKVSFQRAAGSRMFGDNQYIDLRIIAYYPIPASASKKKQAAMEAREVRPTSKPDWDNIGKIVADSLNQVAYRDDAQVVDAQVRKFYSRNPRVDVIVQEVIEEKPNERINEI